MTGTNHLNLSHFQKVLERIFVLETLEDIFKFLLVLYANSCHMQEICLKHLLQCHNLENVFSRIDWVFIWDDRCPVPNYNGFVLTFNSCSLGKQNPENCTGK